MDHPRQEVGALLIVLLQPEVGLNHALQHVVPAGEQSGDRSLAVRGSLFQKGTQGRSADRLQKNVGGSAFGGRAEIVQGGASGADYEINWRVERIRDSDIVLVRDDPTNPDVPSATRIIPLRPEGDEQAALQ